MYHEAPWSNLHRRACSAPREGPLTALQHGEHPLDLVEEAVTIDLTMLIQSMPDVPGELGEPVRYAGHISTRMLALAT